MAASKKKQPNVCEGCKLRDERILVLENLVALHQSEPKRRSTVEVQSDMMVAQANDLAQKQKKLDEVKSDVA